MRTTTSLLFATLALGACGDNLSPGGDGDGDGPGPAGRTVTGSHLVLYKLLDKTLLDDPAFDMSDTLIEGHVARGGGWDIYPGVGHRDGSFEIPGLPDGPMWLRVATRPVGEVFYWTDADHVDFDEPVLGPEDPPRSADDDRLNLALTGLAPWQDGDSIAWFVPEDIVFAQSLVGVPPEPGSTELTGTSVDWSGRPLADTGPGEPAFVVQYRPQELALGVEVIAPIRAASPTMHQVAGTTGTLTATLAAPPVLPYRLNWARDAFEATRAEIHPTRAEASSSHWFSVVAMPGLVDGEAWISVDYPVASLVDPSILEGTTPLDLGELAIPNPYPRAWLTDSYVVTFPVSLPMPDGSPWTIEAAVGTRRTEFPTATSPAAPAITPIRAPKIGWRDAFTDLDGVGLTPVISWQAPATGTATSYELTIVEAVLDPPPPYRPGWYITATLVVPGDVTSLQVPADLLVEGKTYAMIVKAIAQPGQDITTRPFRIGGVYAFAEAVTGRFTP